MALSAVPESTSTDTAATVGSRSIWSNSGVPQIVVPIMLWMKRSSFAKTIPAQPAWLACRIVTGVARPSTSAILPRAPSNRDPAHQHELAFESRRRC